jgi:hypothetical protein
MDMCHEIYVCHKVTVTNARDLCLLPEMVRKLKKNGAVSKIVELCFFFFISGVGLLGTAATTALLYLPRMIGNGDCGGIGGIKISRGTRSTRSKPAPCATLSNTDPT